jgi:hypothetical protein
LALDLVSLNDLKVCVIV